MLPDHLPDLGHAPHDPARLADPKAPPVLVDLATLIPSPWQPRSSYDEETLRSVAESIAEHGLIYPILVRVIGGKYEVIDGERRRRAMEMLQLEGRFSGPVPVLVRDFAGAAAKIIAVIVNDHRKNLPAIDLARGIAEVRREVGKKATVRRLCALFSYSLGKTCGLLKIGEVLNPVELDRCGVTQTRLRKAAAKDLLRAAKALPSARPDLLQRLARDTDVQGGAEPKPLKPRVERVAYRLVEKARGVRVYTLRRDDMSAQELEQAETDLTRELDGIRQQLEHLRAAARVS